MSRITIPTADQTVEASKPLLAAVQRQLGVTPNMMKLLGHSPAALEGYLSLKGALDKSAAVDLKLRERLALAVAQHNGCDYCLSAHTYLARNLAKLDAAEAQAARNASSADARAQAALAFAMRVVQTRGMVTDTDLAAVRSAGFNEDGMLDIVANVALNVLTNYVNNVAQTDVDFPAERAHAA